MKRRIQKAESAAPRAAADNAVFLMNVGSGRDAPRARHMDELFVDGKHTVAPFHAGCPVRTGPRPMTKEYVTDGAGGLSTGIWLFIDTPA